MNRVSPIEKVRALRLLPALERRHQQHFAACERLGVEDRCEMLENFARELWVVPGSRAGRAAAG